MPTYTVTSSNISLSSKKQKELAEGITKIHNVVTGANTYFAQVIFNITKKKNHFMGGKIVKEPSIFLLGQIRAGRPKKTKDKLISDLRNIIIKTLDLNKANDIVSIDLKDKSSIAEYMIIASGTSSRHIQSLSEQVLEKLKDNGITNSKIEGKESNEWKLVDGIDLIIHIFHPEKRKFYELEKIWSELIPKEKVII